VIYRRGAACLTAVEREAPDQGHFVGWKRQGRQFDETAFLSFSHAFQFSALFFLEAENFAIAAGIFRIVNVYAGWRAKQALLAQGGHGITHESMILRVKWSVMRSSISLFVQNVNHFYRSHGPLPLRLS
jgi:hypothetical protein